MAKESRYVRVDMVLSKTEFVRIAEHGAVEEAKKRGWKVKKGSLDHEWMDGSLAVWMDVQVKDEKEARKILKQTGNSQQAIEEIIYDEFLTDEEKNR